MTCGGVAPGVRCRTDPCRTTYAASILLVTVVDVLLPLDSLRGCSEQFISLRFRIKRVRRSAG